MLLSVGYFAVAYWCTTLIDQGAPNWGLHLIVLLCIYNAFEFLVFGPSASPDLKTRHHEEATRTRVTAGQGRSRGHEALNRGL